MAGASELGQLFGERLREIREENGLSQDDVVRRAKDAGLPWARATVIAFESGERRSVTLEELLLLSYAFTVEPSFWFVGKGWAKLTPQAMATLKVIRAMLAGNATAHWMRISQRMWDKPQFKDAPGVVGVQFEKLNARLRRAQEYLGPEFPTEAAILAMQAAAQQAEVKAAYKLRVKPVDISLASLKLWSRSLTQERNRRVGEAARAATFRSLQATRGRITRKLLKELAPTLNRTELVSSLTTK